MSQHASQEQQEHSSAAGAAVAEAVRKAARVCELREDMLSMSDEKDLVKYWRREYAKEVESLTLMCAGADSEFLVQAKARITLKREAREDVEDGEVESEVESDDEEGKVESEEDSDVEEESEEQTDETGREALAAAMRVDVAEAGAVVSEDEFAVWLVARSIACSPGAFLEAWASRCGMHVCTT